MVRKISLKVYKRIFTGVLALGFVAAGVATGAFSFAWFSNNNNITQNINGYTTGAYFARGKGTKDDPYVINRPIHFYNLAWLQYIGYFKGKEPYFVIENDLNMKDMVLPPIRTKENPFLGHLDGTSKKISNLTISNSFDEYKGKTSIFSNFIQLCFPRNHWCFWRCWRYSSKHCSYNSRCLFRKDDGSFQHR